MRDADGGESGFRGTCREVSPPLLASGMEGGLNETYARLDELLARH